MTRNFDHAGFTVSDIHRSTEFYELLGFSRVRPEPVDVDTDWIKTMTGMPEAHLLIQHLSRGDGDTVLELLQYLAPRGEELARMRTADTGSAHVGIGVEDLASEYERLVAAGVRFRSEPIHITEGPFAGVRAVYAEDPDGYTVELLQQP